MFVIFGALAFGAIWFSPKIPFLKDKIPESFRETLIKNPMALIPAYEYSYPSWDVKGERITVVIGTKGKDKIYTKDLFLYVTALDTLKRLTKNKWTDHLMYPLFSPQGNSIVFTVVKGEAGEIYLVDDQGFKSERISQENVSSFTAYSPTIWSPDGQKLLYYTKPAGGKSQVVFFDPGTQERKSLETKGNALFASWSPDGKLMVWQEEENGIFQIFVAQGDGKEPRVITKGGDCRYPVWSPDGSKILFIIYKENNSSSIGVVAPTGENFQIFSGIPPEPQNATWSYDGWRIVFEAKDTGGGFQVFSVNADGSKVEALTSGSEHRYPVWRPKRKVVVCVGKEDSFFPSSLFIASKNHKERLNLPVMLP